MNFYGWNCFYDSLIIYKNVESKLSNEGSMLERLMMNNHHIYFGFPFCKNELYESLDRCKQNMFSSHNVEDGLFISNFVFVPFSSSSFQCDL